MTRKTLKFRPTSWLELSSVRTIKRVLVTEKERMRRGFEMVVTEINRDDLKDYNSS